MSTKLTDEERAIGYRNFSQARWEQHHIRGHHRYPNRRPLLAAAWILTLLAHGSFAVWITCGVTGCGASPSTPTTAKAPATAIKGPDDLKIENNPDVVAVRENNRRINASLASVKDRLANSKLTIDDKVLVEKDLLQAVDLLLPLSEGARGDVDGVTRFLEDIRFQLKTAERSYRNVAELYRFRSTHAQTDNVRSMYERIAEWFDTLAADVPRRQRITEEFLADLRATRDKLAEATRGLQDLRAAYSVFPPDNPDALKVSPEGKAFFNQVQAFLDAVRKYQETYFAGDPFRGTGEKK